MKTKLVKIFALVFFMSLLSGYIWFKSQNSNYNNFEFKDRIYAASPSLEPHVNEYSSSADYINELRRLDKSGIFVSEYETLPTSKSLYKILDWGDFLLIKKKIDSSYALKPFVADSTLRRSLEGINPMVITSKSSAAPIEWKDWDKFNRNPLPIPRATFPEDTIQIND